MEIRIIIINNNQNTVKEFDKVIDAIDFLSGLEPKVVEDLGEMVEVPYEDNTVPIVKLPNISGQTTTTFEQPKKSFISKIFNS